MEKNDVAIIVGSSSDLSLAKETINVLKKFEVSYSLDIASAHRTEEYLKQCVEGAISTGVKVFIAIAGMAAALPGVIASHTILPVVGVPLDGKNLLGLDSLFSIVQMPKGVPVATVALGKTGAINAAILAVQIIAISNDELKEKLKNYKIKISETVVKENLSLQKDGIDKFIERLNK